MFDSFFEILVCDKPCDRREACGDRAREKIRILLQEGGVAEEAGELLCWASESSTNDGTQCSTRAPRLAGD